MRENAAMTETSAVARLPDTLREVGFFLSQVGWALQARARPDDRHARHNGRHLMLYPKGEEIVTGVEQRAHGFARDHRLDPAVASLMFAEALRLAAGASPGWPQDSLPAQVYTSRGPKSSELDTDVVERAGLKLIEWQLDRVAALDAATLQHCHDQLAAQHHAPSQTPPATAQPVAAQPTSRIIRKPLPDKKKPAKPQPSLSPPVPIAPAHPPMTDTPATFPTLAAARAARRQIRARTQDLLAWKARPKPEDETGRHTDRLRDCLIAVADSVRITTEPGPQAPTAAGRNRRCPELPALFVQAGAAIAQLAKDPELRGWAVANKINLNDPTQQQRLTHIASEQLWLMAWDQTLYQAPRQQTAGQVLTTALTRLQTEKSALFAQMLPWRPKPWRISL